MWRDACSDCLTRSCVNYEEAAHLSPAASDILLSYMHISLHAAIVSLYPHLFAIRYRGPKEAWPIQRALPRRT